MDQVVQNYKNLRFVVIPSLIAQIQDNLNQSLHVIDQDSFCFEYFERQEKLTKYQPQRHIQAFTEDLNNQILSQISKLEKYDKSLNHMISKFAVKKKSLQFQSVNEDSTFTQSSSMSIFDDKLINIVANNVMPPAYKSNHVFSICLLEQGAKVGLCLGAQQPFIIYNLDNQKVETIQVEKNGVFDAVEVFGRGIVLGCNKTIKIIRDKKITSRNFPNAQCTPSRLLIKDNNIFATDCLTQLGQGGSYCCQWNFEHDQVINYKMDHKSSGAITIDEDQLIAADLNKKIYIWKMGVPTPIKILRSDEIITSLVTSAQNIIMGAGRTKFYLWDWTKKTSHIIQLDYDRKILNALTLIDLGNNFMVGDNLGHVILLDNKKKTQIQLLKMRSKIMKIQHVGKRYVACSYEGSFCVFDLL